MTPNELFRRTDDEIAVGYQIAVYAGPEGEAGVDRLLTLDALYASVEDAIADEDAARSKALELIHVLRVPVEDPRVVLVVEHVRRVVWL